MVGPTDKCRGELLIKPSKKSIGRVTRKIGDVIKRAETWKQENLINALNPIIIGWSNIGYFELKKLRQKVLKLSGWYKKRWDKPKGWVIHMNAGIISLKCHRNRNKHLSRY